MYFPIIQAQPPAADISRSSKAAPTQGDRADLPGRRLPQASALHHPLEIWWAALQSLLPSLPILPSAAQQLLCPHAINRCAQAGDLGATSIPTYHTCLEACKLGRSYPTLH